MSSLALFLLLSSSSLSFFHPIFPCLFSFHNCCHLSINCINRHFSRGSLVHQKLTLSLWYFHVSVTFACTKVLRLAGSNVKQLMQSFHEIYCLHSLLALL